MNASIRTGSCGCCTPLSRALLAAFSVLVLSNVALATRTVTSVKLNGGTAWTYNGSGTLISAGSTVSVGPGDSITVTVTVTTSGSGSDDDFESVSNQIGNSIGTWLCDDTSPDCTSDCTQAVNLTMIAPATAGTYNSYFRAHDGGTCGGSGISPTVTLKSSVIVESPEPNPELDDACGLDIVLVLDVSGSIGGNLADVQDAANAFISAFLPGTPTLIGLVKFSDTATVLENLTSDTAALASDIAGLSSGGFTNWQDALLDARSLLEGGLDRDDNEHPDLIVIITDGDPTASSAGGNDTAQPNLHLAPAVAQADLAKSSSSSQPIRILAVGVGAATVSRLTAISGTTVSPPTPLSADTDVATGSFGDLADMLSDLALTLCGGTITVHKIIDADGNLATTGDQTDGVGWTFAASPDAPDFSTPASGATDGSGQINFDIDLGADNLANVDITETVQSNYDFVSASCLEGMSSVGTPGSNSVDNISIGALDIITCTFYNKPHRGACCNTNVAGGSCQDDVAFYDCVASGYVWTDGALCSAVNCCSSNALCADMDPCTSDACVSGSGCVHTPMVCDDGNPCTVDQCVGGACVYDPVVCPDNDGNECTAPSCNIAGPQGNCNAVTNINEGGACGSNSNTDCDNPDTCQAGVCQTNYETAGASCTDDGNPCTDDTCNGNGTCTHTADNSNTCTDGLACTNDACVNGACVSTPVTCPDNGNACTDLACNPAGAPGNCSSVVNVNEGGSCGSGSNTDCDNPDTCQAGICQPNYENVGVTCTDDGNACTDDTCDGNGGCVHTPDNSNACTDGLACTNDACVNGTCVSTPVTCPDNGDACTDLACNPAGAPGNCGSVVNVNEGGPCGSVSDTDCDNPDTCQAGVCQPNYETIGTVCPDDGNTCTDDACDGNGNCAHPNDDTNSCTDGVACTVDACVGGSCVGTPNNAACDDSNICTTDICNPAIGDPLSGCAYEAVPDCCVSHDDCDDDNACTANVCEFLTGDCSNPPNVTCPDNGNPCTDLACDPGGADGNCDITFNVNDGGACGSAGDTDCDNPDTCLAGVCQPNNESAGAACTDDGNPCTDEACDGNGNCIHPPDNSNICSDNNACTNDACVDGVCTGSPFSCPDNGNACTDFACDPGGAPGNCAATVNVNEGGPCGNTSDSECDNPDTCQAGVCQPNNEGFGTACPDDGNPCTDDVCDGVGGCTHTNDDSNSCSDGNPCTNDACVAGACVGTPFTCPDNGSACTDAVCNQGGAPGNCDGVVNVNEGGPCGSSADTACDNPDTCQAGVCQPNNEAAGTSCPDDGNPCTDDACDGSGVCGHPADNTNTCTDNNACTNDACVAGTCSSSPVVCPSNGKNCTDLACDPAGPPGNCNSVINVNEGMPCGSFNDTDCDNPDTCQAGICQPNNENAGVPCTSDGNACTNDICSGSGNCQHMPVICPDNGSICTDVVCDPAGAPGNCNSVVNVNEGGACGSPADTDCDNPDTCQAGVCQPNFVGSGAPCTTDNNACTSDLCNGNGNCVHADISGLCSDEQFCTGVELCNPVSGCQDMPDPSCNLLDDACNIGVCDEMLNGCVRVAVNQGGLCLSDGQYCTGVEVCLNGQCISTGDPCPGSLKCDEAGNRCVECLTGGQCNDGDICTDDICTPAGTCANPDNDDCGSDGDRGACCNREQGTCVDNVRRMNCLPPLEFAEGQSCGEIDCVQRVPTVSEWGIAALTLLLLIGAKLRFGHRQLAA